MTFARAKKKNYTEPKQNEQMGKQKLAKWLWIIVYNLESTEA